MSQTVVTVIKQYLLPLIRRNSYPVKMVGQVWGTVSLLQVPDHFYITYCL